MISLEVKPSVDPSMVKVINNELSLVVAPFDILLLPFDAVIIANGLTLFTYSSMADELASPAPEETEGDNLRYLLFGVLLFTTIEAEAVVCPAGTTIVGFEKNFWIL